MRRMKDSGIEWIGEIPDNWTIIPLKFAASFNIQTLPETTFADYCFRYVDIGSVAYGNGITEYKEYIFGEAPSRARRIVSVGDTIISTVRTYLKAIAYINDADNVIVSTGFSVLTPKEQIVPKFLFFSCLSEGFIQEVVKHSSGIAYPAINEDILSSIPILLPTYSEQQSIAAYLDGKCSRIDSVTAKLRSSIEKLKEYRLSLITEAVTKGLDPKAPMRDSGVEWIGEIPEHWTLSRLSFLMKSMEGGVSVNAGQEPAKGDELGVLKTSCVSRFVFYAEENKSVNHDEEHRVACPVTANTIIVNRKNTPELVGACGYTDKSYPNIFLSDLLWQIHFQDDVNVKYVYYFLRSKNVRNYYGSLSTGSSSSMSNITQWDFSHSSIALPPCDEQTATVTYLDGKCSAIDSAIARKQSLIDSLTEYKKSLIYETVTGKREVPCA